MEFDLFLSRVQHGVGQGGFHTSSFYLRDSSDSKKPRHCFELVFDCGTLSNSPDGKSPKEFIAARIAAHKPSHTVVDALFISHLDSDHFNGAEVLCSARQVQQVFLPYFQQDELALFIAQQILSHSRNALGPAGLATAVNALGGGSLFGVPVTLIGAPSDDGRSDARSDQNPERITLVEISPLGARHRVGRSLPNGSHLGMQLAGIDVPWILLPWSYKQSPSGLQQLLTDVPELAALVTPGATAKAQDMEDLLGLRSRIRASLSKIIKFAGGIESADFNAPSICLYSGPSRERSGIRHTSYLQRGTGHLLSQVDPIGWITTGDAVLGKYENEFLAIFSDSLKESGTYVVPHHGARKNHSPKLIYNARGRFALICAKHGSKHHPHLDVLTAVEQVKDDHRIVTEYMAGGVREVAVMRFDAPVLPGSSAAVKPLPAFGSLPDLY